MHTTHTPPVWRSDFHEELVSFLCTDFAAINRGRAFPHSELSSKLKSGIGWVPINQTITAFDTIPDCPHWGAHGDLRLLPDPDTATRVDLGLGHSPLHFFLCNIVELDGTPWSLCSRHLLQQAIRDFKRHTGFNITAAFEQEFSFVGSSDTPQPGFSVRKFRQAEPFGSYLVTALRQAGQGPETFLPEFGQDQFELTCHPTDALGAADQAVIVREITHETARQLGRSLTFSPKVNTEGVGNGVHIHFSFQEESGGHPLYDPQQPGSLSAIGGSFAAGILNHLPGLLAFTAPSVLSYQRLVPHAWSSAYTCLGDRNREAALRICPLESVSGKPPEAQYNLEFRACDATANPYLALAVIIRAGLEGIQQHLTTPALLNSDPNELSESERSELGIKRLPESLTESLNEMTRNDTIRGWFSDAFFDSYVAVRNAEIEYLREADAQTLCNKYAERY